jgi:hypothetical protein
MCIFTGRVAKVSDTTIFARPGTQGRQLLVYGMNVSVRASLAMVLPLPTPPRAPESAVQFIDLTAYPSLFHDLDLAFPPIPPPAAVDGRVTVLLDVPGSRLPVHEVGSFEASFVPSRDDFGRLDRRFRLSEDLWRALPGYHDWGFAVFRLKRTARMTRIHPMAFAFPRREADQLFFPTVHVHDGQVEPWADFNHWLYCQDADERRMEEWYWSFHSAEGWERSSLPLGEVVDLARASDLVRADLPCYRVGLRGTYRNEDVVI